MRFCEPFFAGPITEAIGCVVNHHSRRICEAKRVCLQCWTSTLLVAQVAIVPVFRPREPTRKAAGVSCGVAHSRAD